MEHPFAGLRDTQRCSLITILAILSGALTATSAKAEAARTWVSGAGDDMSQSCSRTEPCRTFNRALLETEAGAKSAVSIPASTVHSPFAL